ncbi:MAG: GNAT family N-acetyltransferase [Anaerolineae bacterium]|jgi:predicted acetyltransferase|nr:GNAT family N-acetyltransferase [Anaerolineae bacterium]MBT7781584.1 GNAT family N-acetyltransferase [Anaerolineae bacterium]
MKLERVSLNPPQGLATLIADLGDGENGFGGTTVPRGELSLDEYIQYCVETNDHTKLESGYIPQSFFWFIDDAGEAIGIMRMWHYLNESLKERTGHISYYIRQDQRGRGYGREALRLGLIELGEIGEKEALIIADSDNIASIKVIQANDGVLESVGQGADSKEFGRYWIKINEKSLPK